jgi:hypothetical protein
MVDEIDQLPKNLGLHRIRETWDREMERATTAVSPPSYRDATCRLLREQYAWVLLRALENGYRGLFTSAEDLFDEMFASLAD